MKADDRSIEITSADKVLFPVSGITKGDLIDYYDKIADYILPHLNNRPLTLQRFPNGIGKEGFYQKEKSDYFPDWIQSVTVKKEDGEVHQVICNDKATLIYLANQACITLHIWLSRKDKVRIPDRMIFDLDPPDDDFGLVLEGAGALRNLLENELHLPAYVMTTGSRGLHVMTPLRRVNDFDEVRDFAHRICIFLAHAHPRSFTVEVRKNKRKGRLFLDYLRNTYAQTGVSPYSLRAREHAPVATPLAWDELDRQDINAQSYNMRNIFRRLAQMNDPWKDVNDESVSLGPAIRLLDKLE